METTLSYEEMQSRVLYSFMMQDIVALEKTGRGDRVGVFKVGEVSWALSDHMTMNDREAAKKWRNRLAHSDVQFYQDGSVALYQPKHEPKVEIFSATDWKATIAKIYNLTPRIDRVKVQGTSYVECPKCRARAYDGDNLTCGHTWQ